jgi:glutathione S-transferase
MVAANCCGAEMGVAMKILTSPTSPFGRKVLIVADEVGFGQRLEAVHVDLAAADNPVVGLNPLVKIPTLVLDDGTAMIDSRVIAEYVADCAGDETIFPRGAERWQALSTQALADGLTESVIATNHENKRAAGSRSQDVIDKHKFKIKRCLRSLEDSIEPWSIRFTIGQISAICALGYLELRLGDGWRQEFSKLYDWWRAQHDRPSVSATAPPSP